MHMEFCQKAAMPDGTSPSQPLGMIALALSGGGYRAAAFHLGTLRTLHEAALLPSVEVLSTVSGGTIVGASYALSLVRQQTFCEFHAEFVERLRTRRPVHRATELLTRRRDVLPRRTLIAAQAEALDEQFYAGAKFGDFFGPQIHLGELILNATDFRSGLPFRFQRSRNRRARIGNGKHWMPFEVARQMRLADIVAASSCFPGGFEPLGFPHDFVWEDRARVTQQLAEHEQAATFQQPLPLMDGGVADNQGLGSLRVALDRREKEHLPAAGLVLISDADCWNEKPLLEHRCEPRPGWLSIDHLLLLGRVLLVVTLIAAGLLGWRLAQMVLTRELQGWWQFVESTFSFGVLALTATILMAGQRVLHRYLLRQLPGATGFDIRGTIGRLSPAWLGDLLWMRLDSLYAMSNSVFMKSVRDLRYREMFESERFRDRVVANLIYELPKRGGDLDNSSSSRPAPSGAMIKVAELACAVPTTLWFDDPRQLDALLLCGRITTCYNLLGHVEQRLALLSDEPPASNTGRHELIGLQRRLFAIWRELEREAAQWPSPPAAADTASPATTVRRVVRRASRQSRDALRTSPG